MHKLLLADDSVTIQRVIELTFSGEDVQVVAVSDGEQAIARIPIDRPDVVLADIGMPRKGGYEVSAFVKSHPDLAHIPVLLLAGAFEPVDQARAEQVKADGVLIKPFEPRQVIERVRELLSVVAQAPAPRPAPQPQPVIQVSPFQARDAAVTDATREAVQSLDELFESLNQALQEPATTVAAVAEPKAPAQLESEFEPEPLVLGPPIAFEPLTVPASNGATLDQYFDRLSAAFEEVGEPARSFQTMPEHLEDLAPIAPQRPPSVAPALPTDEWPAQEWLSPGGTMLSFDRRGDEVNPILEAVTALMAQGSENGTEPAAAAAWPAPAAAPPPEPSAATQDAIVDAITERVLARLVPEVTENLRRLVQQEIAHLPHDIH